MPETTPDETVERADFQESPCEDSAPETVPAEPIELAMLGRELRQPPMYEEAWPHDRQPDAWEQSLGVCEDQTSDAVLAAGGNLPEPRHIPSWAWPTSQNKKRVFSWVTKDAVVSSKSRRRERISSSEPDSACFRGDNQHALQPSLDMMWMLLWQCFVMCKSTLSMVHNSTKDSECCRLNWVQNAGGCPGGSFTMNNLTPEPLEDHQHNSHEGSLVFRRLLRHMPNGQLPKVNDVLSLAAQHSLYKDVSQFKWLDQASRSFQLRTPSQSAFINFYILSGRAFVTGMDKVAGLKFVEKWTDADTRPSRKRKPKMGSSAGPLPAPPLTPFQAANFRHHL